MSPARWRPIATRPKNPSAVSNAARAPVGVDAELSVTGNGDTAVIARRKRSGVVAVRSTSMY